MQTKDKLKVMVEDRTEELTAAVELLKDEIEERAKLENELVLIQSLINQ